MINAAEAAEATDMTIAKMTKTPEFKKAIAGLEVKIKNAVAHGEHKICYNVCELGEDWLGASIYAAIKQHMEKLGYTFYYHNVLAVDGRHNYSFTCEW